MAYKDDEQKRREAQERRKQYEEAAQRRRELLAQNEAGKAAQQSAAQAARQATKATSGASKTSATAAGVNASAAAYQKKRQGDSDMRAATAGRPQKTYDVSQLSYDEAMGVATRIVYDDERDNFLDQWRKYAGQKSSKSYMETVPTMDEMRAKLNAQKPGGIYQAAGKEYSAQIQENFKNEYTAAKTMHAFDGFTDMDGNAVNMNTADLETIIRNIRAEPNKTRREGYAEALKTLTMTPGSRFYGVEFDEENATTFINSAALSEDRYKYIVEGYESIFNPIPGNEQANIDLYAEEMAAIEAGGYDPYVKSKYVDALNDAYRSQLATDTLPDLTGYTPPQEAAEEPEKTAQTGAKEKKGGWWDGIKKAASEAVDGFLGKNPMPDGGAVWNAQGEAYSVEDGVSVEVQPKTGEWQGPKQQEKPKAPSLNEALADEKYMQAFIEKKSAEMAASGEDIREVQGPQIKSLMQRSLEDGEYQAFVQEQMQAGEEQAKEKTLPAGSINLVNNPVAASIYARRGDGDLLDKETWDALNSFVASSTVAKVVFGIDATGSQELYEQAEAGDPFALGRANAARFDYLFNGQVSILGSTLSGYLDKARSSSWPDSLREDMEGVVVQVGWAAEQAYERGEFTYDPEKETLYDAYLKLNPDAEAPLKSAVEAVAGMEAEARERAKLAAEQAEKDEQELLRQSREAVQSGLYTQEDYERVLEGAPTVTTQSAATDATYSAMMQEIRTDRTLADGMEDSWHNRMAASYLKENGKPVDLESAEAMLYKDALAAFEEDVLLSDMRVAATLGYGSLEEMYARWGGMDADKMHDRAEAAMRRMAQSVTEEDVAAIEQAASAYTGTGEGVGYGETILKGAEHGLWQTGSEMLEAIWAYDTISKEDRPSAVANIRMAYTKKYEPAIAAAMYKADMLVYAENAPSKEQGDAIKAYLESGNDPFRLGIDPTQNSIVMDAANEMDARANALSAWAQKNLNQGKGRVFEMASATSSTVTMQTVASGGSFATGNAFIGSMLGYGLVSAAQEMDEQLAAGRSRKDAALMGFLRATSDSLANLPSSNKFTQKLKGFAGIDTAIEIGAKAQGNIGAARTTLGMAKAYGWAFAKGAAEQSFEEVVGDPLREGVYWQFIGGAGEAYLDGASAVHAVTKSLAEIDVTEVVDQTVREAGQNFIYTLPLAVFGGLGDGFKATKRNAMELAASGNPEAAKATMAAMANDLEDPKNRDEMNKMFHDAEVGKEAAVIMMRDETIGPIIDNAAKAQEQADAHEVSRNNSAKAAQMGKESAIAAQERMNAGEINPELPLRVANGVKAYSKNMQGYHEHERERAQKQAEADKGFARGMQEATAQAEASVSAREAEIDNPPQEQIDPQDNVRALEAEEFIAQKYPGASEEARRAIYAEFTQEEASADETPESRLTKANAQFAAQVSRKFGVQIQFSDLGGARGAYSRSGDTITIDRNATQGDVIRGVMVHELTHRTETSGEYESLSSALLAIKYGEDSVQLDADVRSIMNRYEAYYAQQGREGAFTEADARRELVADAAAEIIGGNEEMINRLVAEKPGIGRRILNAIKSVIDRLRGVRDPEMENLRRVEALFEKALRTSGEGQGEQYSLVDVGEMGKGVYESNFDSGTPKDVKRQRTIELWQNVWSQQPIELTIVEDGQPRQITANFDPDYDPQNIRKTDLGKMMHSKNGSGGDRNVTLNLADDLYDIARTSDYHSSEAEQGKTGATHDGVKVWHYFFKDIIYRDGEKETPYTVWMDVKEKDDGGYVYQLYARKTKEKTTQSQSGEIGPGDLSASSSSDTSVAENAAGVNTQSMQNRQFSLPSQNLLRQEIAAWRGARQAEAQQEDARRQGERQFVKKTLQTSRAMPSYIRQTLFNDPNSRYYEMDSNDEQIIRAYQTIQQEGREAATERILTSRELPTKDEIAQANVLMAQAAHDGDMSTLLALSRHYAEDTTQIAQALQSMKIFKRMTPAGAMQAAAAQNEAALSDYIKGHEPMRREVEAAARAVETEIEKKRGGDPIALLGSGETTLTQENSRWGVPINERQAALIKKYKLQNVARPGIHYNRATVEQRMMEAILATPDPLEATNEGLTLITRLEYMKKGAPVVTNADLEYIGHQLALYTAMDADMQEDRIGQLALARAYEANANITQATGFEKINNARFINMLMNLTSPTRNVMGNVLQTTVNTASDMLATAIDAAISLATKRHTKAYITPKEAVQGWEAFVKETGDTFRDYFIDKAIVKQGEGRFDVNRRGRGYQGAAMETARTIESFVMSVGDRNFWKMAYTNSMTEQMRAAKKDGRELDFDAAHEQAERDANYATFNEDNAVRDFFSGLKNAPGIGKAVDLLMPFTGVPTNIMKRQLEYGPVGLAYTCIKHAGRAARKETFDQRAFVEELSRGLTGTGLMVLGFGLKQLGMIHGGASEEEDSKRYYMRTAQGDQYTPYIRVGDENVSLSTFSPAVSPILMGAAAYDAWSGNGDILQAFIAATSGSIDSIIDASYFSSIQELLSGDGTLGQNLPQAILNSAATQSTPSILSQIASSMDPYVRDTKDANWMMQSLKKTMARIPGLRQTLPVKYDVTGEAVKNTKHGWRAVLDPFTTTEAKDDEAVSELIALSDRTGETSFLTGYLISSNSYSLSVTSKMAKRTGTGTEGYKMELTTEQKQEINRRYGDVLFNGNGRDIDGLRKLIDSGRWARMDDEERMEEISDMKSAVKEEVTKWAIKEYGQKE